jgi:hypothetical protein
MRPEPSPPDPSDLQAEFERLYLAFVEHGGAAVDELVARRTRAQLAALLEAGGLPRPPARATRAQIAHRLTGWLAERKVLEGMTA